MIKKKTKKYSNKKIGPNQMKKLNEIKYSKAKLKKTK